MHLVLFLLLLLLVDTLNDDIWSLKHVNVKVPLQQSTSQNQMFTNKSRYNNTTNSFINAKPPPPPPLSMFESLIKFIC